MFFLIPNLVYFSMLIKSVKGGLQTLSKRNILGIQILGPNVTSLILKKLQSDEMVSLTLNGKHQPEFKK